MFRPPLYLELQELALEFIFFWTSTEFTQHLIKITLAILSAFHPSIKNPEREHQGTVDLGDENKKTAQTVSLRIA